jgi:hypothetical protein
MHIDNVRLYEYSSLLKGSCFIQYICFLFYAGNPKFHSTIWSNEDARSFLLLAGFEEVNLEVYFKIFAFYELETLTKF